MVSLATALAACAGCGAVGVTAVSDHEGIAAVEGAIEIWSDHGIGLELRDGGPIWIVAGESLGRPGELVHRSPCERWIVGSRSAIVIAHEIGHALGLEHGHGLMAAAGPVTSDLDADQAADAEHGASILAACR
jgi:hypothetical protein